MESRRSARLSLWYYQSFELLSNELLLDEYEELLSDNNEFEPQSLFDEIGAGSGAGADDQLLSQQLEELKLSRSLS